MQTILSSGSGILRKRTTVTQQKNVLQLFYQTRMASKSGSPYVLKPKYPDFKKVEATRAAYDFSLPIEATKPPNPDWTYGKGSDQPSNIEIGHIEIDPFGEERPMISNYKLLVSGIPRPISFVSTISKDGTRNLAPFSYFQVVDHDPPTFVIGFTARADRPKDTRKNLVDTGECVINIVSDHMVEAVNATSLDIPVDQSEWGLSGFNPAPSTTVKPERVKEAVLSIEGKLLEMKEMDYHGKKERGSPTGALAIIEATRFWVRESAINETWDDIDLHVLRPLVQLGGIQYGRIRETFELPRPALATELADEVKGLSQFINEK